jgi:phosphoglycolate phosphatase
MVALCSKEYFLKYEYLVFDLDGTISDPKNGIVKSLNYSLSAHGFATQDESELCIFIGPPLDSAFKTITKSDDPDLISSLVSKYRERYSDVGFSENVLYDGIPQVLEQLSSIPHIKLGVCTSKRADFAERILELFGLRHFFGFVNGGDVGIEKWQQLSSLLEQGDINKNSVMIGDRYVDITAAQKNNLQSAGVLWGYGSHSELSQLKPSHLFTSPCEIAGLAA